MKPLAVLLVLILATISNAAQRNYVEPQEPIAKKPRCWTMAKVPDNGFLGQYEGGACLGLQNCSLWTREMCPDLQRVTVRYDYDNGGFCMFSCPQPDGTRIYGMSARICNGPICE